MRLWLKLWAKQALPNKNTEPAQAFAERMASASTLDAWEKALPDIESPLFAEALQPAFEQSIEDHDKRQSYARFMMNRCLGLVNRSLLPDDPIQKHPEKIAAAEAFLTNLVKAHEHKTSIALGLDPALMWSGRGGSIWVAIATKSPFGFLSTFSDTLFKILNGETQADEDRLRKSNANAAPRKARPCFTQASQKNTQCLKDIVAVCWTVQGFREQALKRILPERMFALGKERQEDLLSEAQAAYIEKMYSYHLKALVHYDRPSVGIPFAQHCEWLEHMARVEERLKPDIASAIMRLDDTRLALPAVQALRCLVARQLNGAKQALVLLNG